jgi:hypothetical protein
MSMFPDTIYVNNVPYQIAQIEGLRSREDARLLGEANYKDQEINLEANQGKELSQVILLHEVFHIILENGGFREHDERLIDVLATGLYSFVKQNPQLLQFTHELPTSQS